MERYWLLTNTCYGNRLPGDSRGFVGRVWDRRPGDSEATRRVSHNQPGIDCDADIPGLEKASQALLKGPPIKLERVHAEIALDQFRETATIRGWSILAVAIMVDHFHIVVGVPGDPSPSKILGDFKSWGTRKHSGRFGEPTSKTWWTERGSKRKLADEEAIVGAIHYVLFDQPNPLVTWSPDVEPSS